MTAIQTALQHAEQHCRRRGSRLTDKRKQVLTGLLVAKRALSAYELVDYCREAMDEPLAPMSVYRILEFLEGEQLVHRLDMANRYVACVHIACSHTHEASQFLICTSCQRVTEINISKATLRSLQKSVAAAGYTLASQQLELSCLCADCGQQQ